MPRRSPAPRTRWRSAAPGHSWRTRSGTACPTGSCAPCRCFGTAPTRRTAGTCPSSGGPSCRCTAPGTGAPAARCTALAGTVLRRRRTSPCTGQTRHSSVSCAPASAASTVCRPSTSPCGPYAFPASTGNAARPFPRGPTVCCSHGILRLCLLHGAALPPAPCHIPPSSASRSSAAYVWFACPPAVFML